MFEEHGLRNNTMQKLSQIVQTSTVWMTEQRKANKVVARPPQRKTGRFRNPFYAVWILRVKIFLSDNVVLS